MRFAPGNNRPRRADRSQPNERDAETWVGLKRNGLCCHGGWWPHLIDAFQLATDALQASEFRVFGIAVNSYATSRIGRLSNHNIDNLKTYILYNYLHILKTVVNLGILGKISAYPTYPIAVILKVAMHLEDPELTGFTSVGIVHHVNRGSKSPQECNITIMDWSPRSRTPIAVQEAAAASRVHRSHRSSEAALTIATMPALIASATRARRPRQRPSRGPIPAPTFPSIIRIRGRCDTKLRMDLL